MESMGFLAWIVLGGIAGAIAKLIMPGKDPGGIFITIIIGVAGGLLGGFLARQVGISSGAGFFDLMSWVVAVVGALILLFLYRMIKK